MQAVPITTKVVLLNTEKIKFVSDLRQVGIYNFIHVICIYLRILVFNVISISEDVGIV